jgi:hypothetical protein
MLPQVELNLSMLIKSKQIVTDDDWSCVGDRGW